MSDPERFVLRHAREIALAAQVHRVLVSIELSFLEAQVLYRNIWKDVPLRALADYLDVPVTAVKAAKTSLLHKTAAALEALQGAGLDTLH